MRSMGKVDFVVITGDISGHCMPNSDEVLAHISKVLQMTTSFFPNTPIYPLLGNNDVWPHNTIAAGKSPWLTAVNDVFKLQLDTWTDDIYKSFDNGGYYVANIGAGLKLIALNTIYYWVEWKNPVGKPAVGDDPADQFQFLEKQLASAALKNERVWITSHVPPGLQVSLFLDELWPAKFVNQYEAILLKYHHVIAGTFFGHLHRDQMTVISDSNRIPKISQIVSGSICTRDLSNPTFRMISFNNTVGAYEFTDYKQVYYNLSDATATNNTSIPKWREEYAFRDSYQQSPSPFGITEIDILLHKNTTLQATYASHWQVGSPQAQEGKYDYPNKSLLCGITMLEQPKLGQCIAASEGPPPNKL